MHLLKDTNLIYLPWQFKSKRVLSCKLDNVDLENTDIIREWVMLQNPSKITSSHWWYNEIPNNIKEAFASICYSQSIMKMFNDKFGDRFQIDVIYDMNEVYVSPPTDNKKTSDEVFFTKHIDGPYYYIPFASCYRLIIGMDNNEEIKTIFNMNPFEITLHKGDVVAFDFHRECHYIQKNTDKINKDFRVVLKAHFCVYHKSMYIFGRLLTNLSIHYNKKFRNLFLYTLSPKTFMQKTTALNVIFWTKIYHGIEAYIGYNNILYISFMLSITYLFNDIYIFIIGTSYIHYVRYFLTYYYKYNCAYKMFVRDVVLYKLISDINIYMMYFDYLNNREQFIILFWYILSNLHIIKDLGIYKYLLGNILGYIQENQYDTVIRYNIYMYQVLSYVSLQNSEYCKKDHNYLLSTHIGFYILLTIQEFLQI